MLTVKLTMFKESGKYYTEGSYQSNEEHMHEIFEEVKELRDKGQLPGLHHTKDGSRHEYHVLIDVPNHPNNYPHLIPLNLM